MSGSEHEHGKAVSVRLLEAVNATTWRVSFTFSRTLPK